MKDLLNMKFSIKELGLREYNVMPYKGENESYLGKLFIENYIAFARPAMYREPTTIATVQCNKTSKGVILSSKGILKIKDKRVCNEEKIIIGNEIRADVMAMIAKGLELQEFDIEVLEHVVFMLEFYEKNTKNVYEAHVMEHNLTYNPIAEIERLSRMLYWFIHKDTVAGTM